VYQREREKIGRNMNALSNKRYLTMLPEPLVICNVVRVAEEITKNKIVEGSLKDLINCLPEVNCIVLQFLLVFLEKVLEKAHKDGIEQECLHVCLVLCVCVMVVGYYIWRNVM
jgi:RhoGAP domain